MADVADRMRALVVTRPRTCEVQLVPTPIPGPGQVLVRIEGSGLCAAGLALWEGRPGIGYPYAAGAPGHEGWGRVVRVGRDVTRVEVGARVALRSSRALAEYDVASEGAVVPLPATLRGHEVPGEAIGGVVSAWRCSRIEPGQLVAVLGVGFAGALLIQLAARAGARVIALSQRPWSLRLAARMGAFETIPLALDDRAIVAQLDELTGGRGCERVIEATGWPRGLELAGALCRIRGRLVLAGAHPDGARALGRFHWTWRGLDVVDAQPADPDAAVAAIAAGVDALASGLLDVAPLYTHRLPLHRAGEAFELLRTRPDGFVKALLTP
ncbi:MAG TPA: zinc-binding dehydrogenase [Kofleriaceae bacterium]|nr:zinc-binding dehydrogenase [Kofleriaceae bacterium]